jgi:DNA replication protein DnaC
MQLIGPINPQHNDLHKALAARGVTADWLNQSDGDPYSPPNIARNAITRAGELIPWHYRKAVADHPDIRAWIDELVAAAKEEQGHRPVATVKHGRSLLLLGPTGVGKTYQAYGAIRDLALTGVAASWRVTTSANLYAALRPRHGIDSEAEFRSYASAQVLLLDDLGAAKVTEFTEDVNFRLVNHRYEHGLPTLFTSNVLPKELSARLGDRTASRLAEMCQQMVITGKDRRRGDAA